MPPVEVVDETWVGASPQRVAARVADPANWRRWWPRLALDVDELRGVEGVRWFVRGQAGAPSGSMEVWLQPDRDGVRVHYFLRLGGPSPSPRRAQRTVLAHRRRAKRIFWDLKDELEGR